MEDQVKEEEKFGVWSELHLFSHQRLNYCGAGTIYLHCYTPGVISDPIQLILKMNGEKSFIIVFFFSCLIVYN